MPIRLCYHSFEFFFHGRNGGRRQLVDIKMNGIWEQKVEQLVNHADRSLAKLGDVVQLTSECSLICLQFRSKFERHGSPPRASIASQ